MAGINSTICKKSIGNHKKYVNNAIKGSLNLKNATFRFTKQKYPITHKHIIKNGFPAISEKKSFNISPLLFCYIVGSRFYVIVGLYSILGTVTFSTTLSAHDIQRPGGLAKLGGQLHTIRTITDG